MPRGKPILPPLDGTALTEAAWELLVRERASLGDQRPVLNVFQFQALIEASPGTTRSQRELILRQARILLTQLYPHLPFKIKKHKIDHPAALLDRVQQEIDKLNETQFHASVMHVFASMRDAHTVYGAPPPFRGAVAFLPFQMRYWQFGKHPRFLVTRVMHSPLDDGFEGALFGPGAEILQWGDLPIEEHVKRVGGSASAANVDAMYTRGALNCTLRPLTFSKYPFVYELPETWVVYVPEGADSDDLGAIRTIKLPWGFLQGFTSKIGFPNSVFSMSPLNRELNLSNQYIHYCDDERKEQDLRALNDLTQVSQLPNTFEFQLSVARRRYELIDFNSIWPSLPGRKFGYLRIRQFGDGSDDREATARILTEFRRILKIMDAHAPDGLVLDLRSNHGGDVIAAERMLQMLTAERIAPEPFHLANTNEVLGTLRSVRHAGRQALTPEENVSLSKARQALQLYLDLADGAARSR
jgi:hypothetical protein